MVSAGFFESWYICTYCCRDLGKGTMYNCEAADPFSIFYFVLYIGMFMYNDHSDKEFIALYVNNLIMIFTKRFNRSKC